MARVPVETASDVIINPCGALDGDWRAELGVFIFQAWLSGQETRPNVNDKNHSRLHIAVVGASSGIGAAISRALSSDGHQLYLCARRSDMLKAVAEDCPSAKWRRCDMSKEVEAAEFAAWVGQETDKIDVLINCAATIGPIGPLWQVGFEKWRTAIEVNLFGTFLAINNFIPLMKHHESSRIINLAGGGAFNAFPYYSAYAVSKAAVVRLTETLAVELAPMDIAVNAMAPGFVATDIHSGTLAAGPEKAGTSFYEETRRKLVDGATPIEVPVECVRFLISEEASGLTGKTISAGFDPWGSSDFRDRIAEINESDVYAMRRINPVDLPPGSLKTSLDSGK
jgi:3-oxoacyl-[acyl-carrier protein] reductase